MTVSYASLLNAKIIEPTKDGFFRVDRHFLVFCMQPLLAKIKVDDDWYLKRYPDVQLAIDNDVIPNATAHYTTHGYFENRMPYRIEVDPDWYLQQYPDVRLAIEREEFASAHEHFEKLGFAEGRFPYANFTLATLPDPVGPTLSTPIERVRGPISAPATPSSSTPTGRY